MSPKQVDGVFCPLHNDTVSEVRALSDKLVEAMEKLHHELSDVREGLAALNGRLAERNDSVAARTLGVRLIMLALGAAALGATVVGFILR